MCYQLNTQGPGTKVPGGRHSERKKKPNREGTLLRPTSPKIRLRGEASRKAIRMGKKDQHKTERTSPRQYSSGKRRLLSTEDLLSSWRRKRDFSQEDKRKKRGTHCRERTDEKPLYPAQTGKYTSLGEDSGESNYSLPN